MVEEETEELKVVINKDRAQRSADAGQETKIDPAAELPAPDADEALSSAAETVGPAEAGATGPTEVDSLKAERDQLLDRLARLQAEFDNARKRAEREPERATRLCDW